MKKLSREEKERLYIRKMTELQIRWANPIDDDWDFSDWTDEELDESLDTTVKQLRFEKGVSFIKKTVLFLAVIFILFEVVKLLGFKIKWF